MAERPPPARPNLLVAIAGTGTEIGKTFVTVGLAESLRAARWSIAARKPAQSFDPLEPTAHDADLLAAATGDDPGVVCPDHRCYETPMAPPMAAEALGRASFDVATLRDEIEASWPPRRVDVGMVELAGGVASPMADNGDGAALSAALDVDLVVLVADAGLGTLNSVRLCLAALAELAAPVIVHLNRFDATLDLHRRNRSWLVDRDLAEVTTDIDALVEVLLARTPAFCGGCGRRASDCPGDCRRALDPDRHCDRCGRAMAVRIIPTGHQAVCKVHGPR